MTYIHCVKEGRVTISKTKLHMHKDTHLIAKMHKYHGFLINNTVFYDSSFHCYSHNKHILKIHLIQIIFFFHLIFL